MKFRDRLGNELGEGDTVAWLIANLTLKATITKCAPVGHIALKNGARTDAELTFEVKLKWPADKIDRTKDIQVGDFIKTVNSEQEQLLQRFLEEQPTQ